MSVDASDGVALAYRVFGGADADPDLRPVVLVHGFASSGETTWGLTGWIARMLESSRAVVVPDLRGHGASGKPREAAAYTPERLGRDLLAVADAAGAEEVDLVGYSLGTRVISAFAALAPERIGRIVFGGAGERPMFDTWDGAAARAVLAGEAASADPLVQQLLVPALAAGADARVLASVIEGMAAAPLGVPDGIPLCMVVGAADPVPVGARGLAERWGAEFLELPGRDHVSTVRASAFQRAAIAFLDPGPAD
nr:alpha/beta fold hydrolase [Agromyces seonyuensis]